MNDSFFRLTLLLYKNKFFSHVMVLISVFNVSVSVFLMFPVKSSNVLRSVLIKEKKAVAGSQRNMYVIDKYELPSYSVKSLQFLHKAWVRIPAATENFPPGSYWTFHHNWRLAVETAPKLEIYNYEIMTLSRFFFGTVQSLLWASSANWDRHAFGWVWLGYVTLALYGLNVCLYLLG